MLLKSAKNDYLTAPDDVTYLNIRMFSVTYLNRRDHLPSIIAPGTKNLRRSCIFFHRASASEVTAVPSQRRLNRISRLTHWRVLHRVSSYSCSGPAEPGIWGHAYEVKRRGAPISATDPFWRLPGARHALQPAKMRNPPIWDDGWSPVGAPDGDESVDSGRRPPRGSRIIKTRPSAGVTWSAVSFGGAEDRPTWKHAICYLKPVTYDYRRILDARLCESCRFKIAPSDLDTWRFACKMHLRPINTAELKNIPLNVTCTFFPILLHDTICANSSRCVNIFLDSKGQRVNVAPLTSRFSLITVVVAPSGHRYRRQTVHISDYTRTFYCRHDITTYASL